MNFFKLNDICIANCDNFESDSVLGLYNSGLLNSHSNLQNIVINNDISGISSRITTKLKKRMSSLSQGVCFVLDSSIKDKILETDSIYFFTAYGEIDTTDRIIKSIVLDNSNLVSPTDFHNSVHNTPLSYYTIINQLHNPAITISDGNNTGETFIQYLNNMIQLNERAVICSGDESSSFFSLDSVIHKEIVSSFCSFTVEPNTNSGGRFLGFFQKLDVILKQKEFLDANNIFCSKDLANIFKDSTKTVISEYAIVKDSPCGIIYRLLLPFYLKMNGIVIEQTSMGYAFYEVKL